MRKIKRKNKVKPKRSWTDFFGLIITSIFVFIVLTRWWSLGARGVYNLLFIVLVGFLYALLIWFDNKSKKQKKVSSGYFFISWLSAVFFVWLSWAITLFTYPYYTPSILLMAAALLVFKMFDDKIRKYFQIEKHNTRKHA